MIRINLLHIDHAWSRSTRFRISINMRRNRLRYGRPSQPLARRVPGAICQPQPGWEPFVRRYRSFPVAGSPAPFLHRLSAQVTPTRWTAACDPQGAPGRVEWHHPRLRQDRLCAACYPE